MALDNGISKCAPHSPELPDSLHGHLLPLSLYLSSFCKNFLAKPDKGDATIITKCNKD